MAGHFAFIARVADTYAQAVKILVITQFADNVAPPVLTTMATAEFEFGLAGGQIQLVMHQQTLGRGQLIKIRQRLYRITAEIPKGGGNQQPAILSANTAFAIQTAKLEFRLKLGAFVTGQMFEQPGTGRAARGVR